MTFPFISELCPLHIWVRYVIANDLSPAAVEAMQRNVELNGLGEKPQPVSEGETVRDGDDAGSEKSKTNLQRGRTIPAKVRINEGDAW